MNDKEFSRVKGQNYKKIQDDIIKKVETLQLNSSVLENLVQLHYEEIEVLSKYLSVNRSMVRLLNAMSLPNLATCLENFPTP